MVEPLWRWDELVMATGGIAEGAAAGGVAGISIDTRTLQPGDLFVALRGDNQDGHVYVTKAFEKGAAAALVSRDFVRPAGAGPLVRVSDPVRDPVLAALERMGIAARARLAPEARIIAVTGSVGKTSTKQMLQVCLTSVDPRTHASEKSYNNHWGVPLTLACMPRDTRFGVFEIGMNHAGEIRPLTKMVRPHVAIITTVGPVHLGHFRSVEEIADAKAEIFEGLEAPPSSSASDHLASPLRGGAGGGGTTQSQPLSHPPTRRYAPASPQGGGGATKGEDAPRAIAVLPADNPYFERLEAAALAHGAVIWTFGAQEGRRPTALLTSHHQVPGNRNLRVDAKIRDRSLGFWLGPHGLHHAHNALSVVLAGEAVGLEVAKLAQKLDEFEPADGRGAVMDFAIATLIDESYNANPLSMVAAVQALPAAEMTSLAGAKRRIAVLGDMRELGNGSVRLHRELLEPVKAAHIDKVFACGPYMKELYDLLPEPMRGAYAQKSEGLIAPLLEAIQPGDVIMIKGSLGTRMAPIVEAVKKHLAEWAAET